MSHDPVDGPAPQQVIVATGDPVPLSPRSIADDRTPEGLLCMGTFIGDRLVARCVVEPEAMDLVREEGLFEAPVRLALAAIEAPPGLQCRLFALVPMPEEGEGEEEDDETPWASSVPGSGYEATIREQHGDHGVDPAQGIPMAAVLLGEVVRFARDRRHPDNLGQEAADVLGRIVHGEVTEVVDRALEDLLGS